MKAEFNNISIQEAAELLEVSTATVSNWIRSGMIEKNENGISYKTVKVLKSKITSGKIQKLNFRANKIFSSKKFQPSELSAGVYNADIIYQSDKTAGAKSKEGSFYTPDNIIDEIIRDYSPSKGSKICDPCCGTGRFLKNVVKNYKEELILFGFDTDKTAVKIANTELKTSGSNKIYIKHFDSLIDPEKEKYDFIFTNPPWGARYSVDYKKRLKKVYPESGSNDSLEYFLYYGYRSVKQNGIISYILPESLLYVKRFRTLREFILKKTSILKIKSYGRVFSKVFTPVIRLDIKKHKPSLDHLIETAQGNILQSHFVSEPDSIFSISMSNYDRNIIKRIFDKPYITLKNNAVWSLGIVTGNNKRFVKDATESEYSFEVITGKNIESYKIKGKCKYLYNDFNRFQQVSKKNYFTVQEKLIYKFISNKLVFAYDNSGMYTLNSANVLIPKLKNYPIKTVMAILNSDLMNFIYRKRFNSLKILRTKIELLPFPENPDKKIINLIEGKTNCIINNEPGNDRNRREIEILIYKLFGVKNESTISDPKKKIISRT